MLLFLRLDQQNLGSSFWTLVETAGFSMGPKIHFKKKESIGANFLPDPYQNVHPEYPSDDRVHTYWLDLIKRPFWRPISVCQGELSVLFCLSANTKVCTKWWPSVPLLRNGANDILAANPYWLAWDFRRFSWQAAASLVNTFGVLFEISILWSSISMNR